jgi:hypothetical protein
MLIDRIFQKVKAYINTEGRGNFSPTRFNLLLHDQIQRRNEEYLFEINRLLNRQNRGMGGNALENLPDRYREKVLHYLTSGVLTYVLPNTLTKPSDCRYIDSIDGTSNLEFCKSVKEFNIIKTVATSQYPIYTVVGPNVKVAPDVTGNLEISYLRNPLFPKWTFTIYNDVELFNPSAVDFVDADIHPSEEDEMVTRVLLAFGVNLKEQDVQNFARTEKTNEFNQNNAT